MTTKSLTELEGKAVGTISDLPQAYRDIMFFTSCLYGNENVLPVLYPTTTNITPVAVNPSATAHTWGSWVEILPDATIDGETGTYFDVLEMEITSISAGDQYYFEFAYSPDSANAGSYIVGRGMFKAIAVAGRIILSTDFKKSATMKVTGRDLYMRTLCGAASKNCSVLPILWCSGSPTVI